MNADPRVMEHLPGVMSREESDSQARRFRAHFEVHGFGFWAVSRLDETADFIGFIGLAVQAFRAPFTPCVEIGWRLAAEHWNRGLATEGARTALEHGFGALGLREIVAYTVPANLASRRVMEKLGMSYLIGGDFDHPRLPIGHSLRRHVLYRLARPDVESPPSRALEATLAGEGQAVRR
jgi:RimJ/RimL family protein N-acetyltransferase